MPRFETRVKGNDWVLLAGVAIMLVINIAYMTVFVPVLPLTSISLISPRIVVNPEVFWPSYAAWVLIGFLLLIRNAPEKKKYPTWATVFVVLLVGSYVVAGVYPIVSSFTWAFFGAWLGAGFYPVAIVIARHSK